MSRPADAPIARDYFFDIPENANKWIASVEGDGIGLLHRSSDRLIGRKMFVWGSTPGGNHWNNWLTDGRDYYEIQAGLAKTQFQHFPIGAREIITWQEGYRALRIDDVNRDFRAICTNIDAAVSPCDWGSAFEIVHEDAPVLLGSGRGRLAELLCPGERSSICSFPDESLGEDEAYFVSLLRGEAFTGDTSGYASDARWLEIIEAKPDKSDLDNLQSGVLYLANNKPDEALHRLAAVGGKHRWLAAATQAMVLSTLLHDDAAAMPFIREAMRLRPDDEPLAVLYGELCIRAGRFDEFVQYYQTDRRFAGVGRVRMYAAKCLAEVDALDEAAAILDESLVVPDIREGEYAISRIWVELYKKIIARDERRESAEISEAEVFLKHPLPVSLDFRMH